MRRREPDARHLIGPALVLISAVSFGFMPLFSRWAERGGVALEMKLGLRFLLGAGILTGLALKDRLRWPRGRVLGGLVLLGSCVYVAEAYCYFAALSRGTPSGLVSLLLYMYPVSVTVGAWLLFRERLTPARGVALGIAMVGLVLTIGPLELGGGKGLPGGVVGAALGLASGIAYAVYMLASSRLVQAGTAMTSAAVVCWSAAAVFLAIAAAGRQALPSSFEGVLGVVALGTVSTAVALSCLLAGAARVGPVSASTLSIVEPVTTVAIGALLLGERVGLLQLVGGVMILAGAAMVARSGVKRS